MRFALRSVGYAVGFLVTTLGVAVIARGWDLDQLRSRSALSRAAAAVEPWLWGVQSFIFSFVPAGRISEHRWVIPLAIVVNTVACGVLLATVHAVVVRVLDAQHRRTGGGDG